MGLLDNLNFNDPQTMGLLNAGLNMLGNSGASRNPMNLGQILGSGLQTYAGTQDQFRQRQQQDEDHAYTQQMRNFKTDEIKQGLADRETSKQNAAKIQELIRQYGNDYKGMVRAGVPFEIAKQLHDSDNLGRSKVTKYEKIADAQGNEVLQGFDDYGVASTQSMPTFRAPQMLNLGDRYESVAPKAGQAFKIGMSPSDKAANSRAYAQMAQADRHFLGNQNLKRQEMGMDGGETQIGLNKQFGKPQAGYRWKADGSLEFIPGGPADQKAQLKTSGEETVDSVVADLRDKYDKLNSGGGIVNDKEGMIGNIGARIASTGIGQSLGGAVGTTNQTSRDNIAMTRPLLLQSIMKATGMSAKQMDSNAELKLYLATATDPTKGYQANMEALDRIEQLYGGGQKEDKTAKLDSKPTANLMQKLPTANASNKGRKIRNTSTGEVLISNGMAWVKE